MSILTRNGYQYHDYVSNIINVDSPKSSNYVPLWEYTVDRDFLDYNLTVVGRCDLYQHFYDLNASQTNMYTCDRRPEPPEVVGIASKHSPPRIKPSNPRKRTVASAERDTKKIKEEKIMEEKESMDEEPKSLGANDVYVFTATPIKGLKLTKKETDLCTKYANLMRNKRKKIRFTKVTWSIIKARAWIKFNALQYILGFLHDYTKTGLVFHCQDMWPYEKKLLNRLVNHIMRLKFSRLFLNTVEQITLMAQIDAINGKYYRLKTYGSPFSGKIYFYKEAHYNVYVITPPDLRNLDENDGICEGIDKIYEDDYIEDNDENIEDKDYKHNDNEDKIDGVLNNLQSNSETTNSNSFDKISIISESSGSSDFVQINFDSESNSSFEMLSGCETQIKSHEEIFGKFDEECNITKDSDVAPTENIVQETDITLITYIKEYDDVFLKLIDYFIDFANSGYTQLRFLGTYDNHHQTEAISDLIHHVEICIKHTNLPKFRFNELLNVVKNGTFAVIHSNTGPVIHKRRLVRRKTRAVKGK